MQPAPRNNPNSFGKNLLLAPVRAFGSRILATFALVVAVIALLLSFVPYLNIVAILPAVVALLLSLVALRQGVLGGIIVRKGWLSAILSIVAIGISIYLNYQKFGGNFRDEAPAKSAPSPRDGGSY